MSMCTLARVGLGEPHQLGTATKSSLCFAMREVILKGPVPTAVAGFDHQLSKSCLTAFWSTIMPVESVSAMAESHQPAGALSVACTVYPVAPSGAVRPDMVTDGSLASSFVSSAAPTAFWVETVP